MRSRLLWLVAALATAPPLALGQTTPNESVVLTSPAQAVETAFARAPVLRSAGAARQVVRAEAIGAPLRPNPQASFTAENFGGVGGRGSLRGARGLETTAGVAQRLEIGGQRAARIAAAARNGEVAVLDFESARLDLARDVVTSLAEAEAFARLIVVERERARLAFETLRAARARFEAGRDPLLQTQRAEVVRAQAEIAVERARREAEQSLVFLAALIGVQRVELAPRIRWFEDVGPAPRPPVPTDPILRLSGSPDLLRLDAMIAASNAALTLQRANAIPGLTVEGYVRRSQESGETSFVAGASIPLPIYDRNQGGIARARAELLRAEAEADRGRRSLAAALIAAEQRQDLAWRTVQTLRRDALPAAENAARFAAGGFAEGKFSFLEVLDAQRALSDTRAQLIDAYREFHARRAAADRLRGVEAGTGQNGGGR